MALRLLSLSVSLERVYSSPRPARTFVARPSPRVVRFAAFRLTRETSRRLFALPPVPFTTRHRGAAGYAGSVRPRGVSSPRARALSPFSSSRKFFAIYRNDARQPTVWKRCVSPSRDVSRNRFGEIVTRETKWYPILERSIFFCPLPVPSRFHAFISQKVKSHEQQSGEIVRDQL